MKPQAAPCLSRGRGQRWFGASTWQLAWGEKTCVLSAWITLSQGRIRVWASRLFSTTTVRNTLMLHDVTIDVSHPAMGMQRHVVQVDASSGDDAVAQGMVRAAEITGGMMGWKIVGVAPSGAPAHAPVAVGEGDDVPDDDPQPARRKPGRPARAALPPVGMTATDDALVADAVSRIMADDDPGDDA